MPQSIILLLVNAANNTVIRLHLMLLYIHHFIIQRELSEELARR